MKPQCVFLYVLKESGCCVASIEGCIQQLLLRQLLMSERQQLAGLPAGPLPASSQMVGLGLEGHRG